MTSGQITYDLRRLRTHGLIERIPHTHRYQLTDQGLRNALFLTRTHHRLLPTGLAEPHGPPTPSKLHTAARAYETAITNLTRTAGLAA
jgi:Mn-dependent DtxR family transcriptional regulator